MPHPLITLWYSAIDRPLAATPVWVKHGVAGIVVSASTYFPARWFSGDPVIGAVIASGCSITAAVVKEWMDARTKLGTPSLAASLWTAGGGILCALLLPWAW